MGRSPATQLVKENQRFPDRCQLVLAVEKQDSPDAVIFVAYTEVAVRRRKLKFHLWEAMQPLPEHAAQPRTTPVTNSPVRVQHCRLTARRGRRPAALGGVGEKKPQYGVEMITLAATTFTMWLIFASQGAHCLIVSPIKEYPTLRASVAETDELHRTQGGVHALGERGASSIYTCRPTGAQLLIEPTR
jgi:hypothetical protein